jgi:hypothetical protein
VIAVRTRIALLAVALAATLGATAATAATRPLQVVSFNVLAPPWAAPDWYPAGMDMSLLSRDYRRPRIQSVLAELAPTTDVVCLQEVVDAEFPSFVAALGSDWVGVMAHNDRDWWSNWIVPGIPCRLRRRAGRRGQPRADASLVDVVLQRQPLGDHRPRPAAQRARGGRRRA